MPQRRSGSCDGAPETAQGTTTARPHSGEGTGASGATGAGGRGTAGVTAEEFEAQRPRLFGLAYRLLGSAVDAEDMVQDAYLRWQGAIGKFGAGARAVFAEVNGEPAIVGISGGTVVGVLVLEVSGGEIGAVRAVANPDKLRFAARQAMGLSHPESLPGLS